MYGCAGVQISNNAVSVQNAYELDTACTSDCTCTGVPKRSLARNSTVYSCYSPVATSVVTYFTMQVLRACLLLCAGSPFTAPPVSRHPEPCSRSVIKHRLKCTLSYSSVLTCPGWQVVVTADLVQPVTVSLDDIIGTNAQTRTSGDGSVSFTGENTGDYPPAVSADPASRYCFTGSRPYSTQGMPQQQQLHSSSSDDVAMEALQLNLCAGFFVLACKPSCHLSDPMQHQAALHLTAAANEHAGHALMLNLLLHASPQLPQVTLLRLQALLWPTVACLRPPGITLASPTPAGAPATAPTAAVASR